MKYKLLGAIVGDIFGRSYEWDRGRQETLDFDIYEFKSSFTDDTVCTIAIADAILKNPDNPDFTSSLVKWCRKYYDRGFGQRFLDWFMGREHPVQDSYGNGAAMRISPCGYPIKDTPPEWLKCFKWTKAATKPSHDHPDSYAAAMLVTQSMLHAYTSGGTVDKNFFLSLGMTAFPDYDFSKPIEEVRKDYAFDCTCAGSVPQALRCFYESTSYEDCLRRCIWLGGDVDTTCAIAGSIAYAYYQDMPQPMIDYALSVLPKEMIDVIERFDRFLNE